MRASVLLLVALVLVAPIAGAQDHEHPEGNGIAYVLHDGPDDGRAVVGAYTHFGFALLDKDGKPTPHQNAEFMVTQAGRTIFATTDTHEYDGIFSFDVRFTRPGPYEVTAKSGEMAVGVFRGEAILPVNSTAANVLLTATPAGPASRVVDVELSIVDDAGAIIPHTDAIVEVRGADGVLSSRTHLHVHDEPIRFRQALPAGESEVQVIGYQAFNRGRAPDVPAVFASFPVSAGPLAAPVPPMPEVAPPRPLGQVGPTATAGGLTLHLMFDPNQQLGVGQLGRIAAVVVDDANHSTKQHVDFSVSLSGPRGLVFASDNGHEYDGVFEYEFRPDAPGFYDGVVTATTLEGDLSVPIHVVVVPPAVPIVGGTGLVRVAIEGLDGVKANEVANLTFSARSAAGPAKHSEVQVTVFRQGEAPLYQFKLHTHASGLTNALLSLPEEGTWQVRVDPFPTLPEASVYEPLLLAFDVAAGAPVEEAPLDADVEDAARLTLPGPAALVVTLAAAGLALVRSRRR